MKPLRLVLLFHINQWLLSYALLASRVCYRGLLEVLRRHRSLPIALHVSGTLIHALKWLDPEPLERVREGLADGQFELLGSTYAQNVAYATDDADNAVQIAVHRELVQNTFGISPTGFWNPERCWRSSLVPVITGAGYRYTFVEDGLLRQTGGVPHRLRSLAHLTLLCDDQELKHRFNLAIWAKEREPLLSYLEGLWQNQREEDWVAVYAEDGEACGLWGYHRGLLPQAHWTNLDKLLGVLAEIPWLEVVLPSAVASKAVAAPLPDLSDGQASWMTESLRTPGAPYHEDGYQDWFDFARRSPKLKHFRQVYSEVRERIQQIEAEVSKPPARRLIELAWQVFAAHQYEFGCVGIGRVGIGMWEGARQALVVARAALQAEEPPPGSRLWVEDVNQDDQEEILLCDGRTFAVLSGRAGRLLYAFDLASGQCWVGNPALEPGWWEDWDEHIYAADTAFPEPWLPGSAEPDIAPFADHVVLGDLAQVMPHLLPEHLLNELPPQIPLHYRPADGPGEMVLVPAGRRALNERVWIDGTLTLQPGELGNAHWEKDGEGLVWAGEVKGIHMRKRVALRDGTIKVHYRLENRGVKSCNLVLEVENELCPDALTLLNGGRAAGMWGGHTESAAPTIETWGVINRPAGSAVRVETSNPPDEITGEVVIGALVLRYGFSRTLTPGETWDISLLARIVQLKALQSV